MLVLVIKMLNQLIIKIIIVIIVMQIIHIKMQINQKKIKKI